MLRGDETDHDHSYATGNGEWTYDAIPGGWGGLTAVTVAPDGAIFAGMGYGSQMIHKFDATGRVNKLKKR